MDQQSNAKSNPTTLAVKLIIGVLLVMAAMAMVGLFDEHANADPATSAVPVAAQPGFFDRIRAKLPSFSSEPSPQEVAEIVKKYNVGTYNAGQVARRAAAAAVRDANAAAIDKKHAADRLKAITLCVNQANSL